jgi:hypothetical protein
MPLFLAAPPVPLMEKTENASPAVAVTKDGRVAVAVVVWKKNAERIWIRWADGPQKPFKQARPVTPGVRAWHPVLAASPTGDVWLAWCGIGKLPKRGTHRRDVMIRRIAPKFGPVVRVSNEGAWSCNPELAVDGNGRVHVVFEEWNAGKPGEVRIAYRALSPQGRASGGVEILSAGAFSRRPDVCVCGGDVHVAWDGLVDAKPSGAADPDYDVFLRSRSGDSFGAAIAVDQRAGIQAAPDLACAPGGGVLAAYHSSHVHSLVKWWTIRRVQDGRIAELAARDPSDVKEPQGEMQGAEFPALAVLKDRLAVVTRPSQGAYLQTVDAAGISPVQNLTRHGWGSRGMFARAAPAPDGSLLVARRARDQSVLQRSTFEEAGAGFPEFRPVADEKQVTPAKSSPAPVAENAGVWPGIRVYFGDIHMHSAATDGTGPPDEIYARAWVRGHDFAALTDHDVIVGRRLFPSLQDEIAWLTDVFDAKEGFSTLHAYEWTTPALPQGSGHRNVYFRSHAPLAICGSRDRCPDTKSLNRFLKGERAVAVPHHTSWTGTDWKNADPGIQRLFEIVSVHGVSEYAGNRPIRSRDQMKGMFAQDGLGLGLKFGFVGGSDAHGLLWHHGIGRKRDPWSCGLTGVLAKGNSRSELYDAMYARRTFATSGEKLWVLLRVGEVLMGGESKLRSPVEVHYGVFTTRPLAYFEIVRDTEVVFRAEPGGDVAGGRFKDENVPPGPHVYYLRAVQGEGEEVDMAWASPVFVTVLKGD